MMPDAHGARRSERAAMGLHLAVGAVLGVLLLHPVTMVVYWLEFRPEPASLLAFVWARMTASASPRMLAMNGLFALLGAAVGGVFGAYHWRLARKKRALRSLVHELGADLRALIAGGESEQTEFKSTARWDLRQQKVSKELEDAIVKTIGGFLNHSGGSLVVGVSDGGEVVGLQPDYGTLKQKNRDGFEQFVMSLVKDRLGGQVCGFVHPVFVELDGADVCRLVVEPCDRPVYVSDRAGARYFLRTGNATRELDVREAVEHVLLRAGRRRRRRPAGDSPLADATGGRPVEAGSPGEQDSPAETLAAPEGRGTTERED